MAKRVTVTPLTDYRDAGAAAAAARNAGDYALAKRWVRWLAKAKSAESGLAAIAAADAAYRDGFVGTRERPPKRPTHYITIDGKPACCRLLMTLEQEQALLAVAEVAHVEAVCAYFNRTSAERAARAYRRFYFDVIVIPGLCPMYGDKPHGRIPPIQPSKETTSD